MFLLISFLITLSHGFMAAADNQTTSIGAIINLNSRAGKEAAAAMTIAVTKFNEYSTTHNLILHLVKVSGEPLQAASAAQQLIKKQQVEVIVGMQTWQEAALVASVGKQAKVPVISLAGAAIPPPLSKIRWPNLVGMTTDSQYDINCIAAIVNTYNWRRVIVIYEDDMFGGEPGMSTFLTDSLQSVGSQIDYHLILPRVSSLSDEEKLIGDAVSDLIQEQTRVFIVLQLSIETAAILFREAKNQGLMGKDSVWLITDTIASLLDSVDKSYISNMQGVVGIKTYYSEENENFLEFKDHFRKTFRSEYPNEDNSDPGIHALRAYDSITTIAKAVNTNYMLSSEFALEETIRKSNFTGLSGDIRFGDTMILSDNNFPIFRIINVVGKKYKELGFWSPKFAFSDNLNFQEDTFDYGRSMKALEGLVNWPGNLNRDPKGWAMPNDKVPMKIGIPDSPYFQKFVKVQELNGTKKYSGLCVDLLNEVQNILKQSYEFELFNGTYSELLDQIIFYETEYSAAFGDVTRLAYLSRYVDFTVPFVEVVMTMLVPVERRSQGMDFVKPFTKEMWTATGALLLYTIFIVWFLEHRSNPEFSGPWKDQLGTALWFAFSSLFFAHREKIRSNLTKVVVVVWLFVVLVLSSSYTASLTALLTVPRHLTDMESLRKSNVTIGYNGAPYAEEYLKNVFGFEKLNRIQNQSNYPVEFKNGNISAAFLELPYEKDFLEKYCSKYIAIGPLYRVLGLGFISRKGSFIATDFSEAIQNMSTDGSLKRMENEWLSSSLNCLSSDTASQTNSLSLDNVWGIFLISGAISTICLLTFIVRPGDENPVSRRVKSAQSKIVKLVRYFHNGASKFTSRTPTFTHAADGEESSYSKREFVSTSNTSDHLKASSPVEIEISK